jgi:hypothetical protein
MCGDPGVLVTSYLESHSFIFWSKEPRRELVLAHAKKENFNYLAGDRCAIGAWNVAVDHATK